MERVTVEDCIEKVESTYEIVLVERERATQLKSGWETDLEREDDKKPEVEQREIAEEKIKVEDLTESGIYKLRKHVEQVDESSETDEEVGDDFENLYKGEISKSGVPILPSKRARKIPEKIQVEKDDLKDLNNDSDQLVATEPQETEEEVDLSLEQIKEEEISSEENTENNSDS